MSDGQPGWHTGPIRPEQVRDYLDWLLDQHDGDLVEDIGGGPGAYHVEVTALKEQSDGMYRAISGANAPDNGGPDDA